jgi:hypothetical protein
MEAEIVFLDDVEPDGIMFRVSYTNGVYCVVCIHPDGRYMTETFLPTFEPRFGPDAADVGTAEEIMERLINKLRNNG